MEAPSISVRSSSARTEAGVYAERSRVGSGCSCTSASAALTASYCACACAAEPPAASNPLHAASAAATARAASSSVCTSGASIAALPDQLRSLAVLFIQQTLALRGGVGQLLARLPPRVEARCILGCVRGKFVAAAIPIAYKERLGRIHIGLILAVMPAVEDKFDSSSEGQRSTDGAKRQIF